MVTSRLASATLSRANEMEARTEAPIPNISAKPVTSMKMGAAMLIAAKASLPTLCPTKMPSVIFITEPENMPNKVGKNIFAKSRRGDIRSKSNAAEELISGEKSRFQRTFYFFRSALGALKLCTMHHTPSTTKGMLRS